MLHLDELKLQGRDITANDRYDRLAINSALASLAVSQRAMVLAALHEAETAAEGLAAWRQRNAEALERCEKRLSAAITSGSVSVARLTVAASQVRELAELT